MRACLCGRLAANKMQDDRKVEFRGVGLGSMMEPCRAFAFSSAQTWMSFSIQQGRLEGSRDGMGGIADGISFLLHGYGNGMKYGAIRKDILEQP